MDDETNNANGSAAAPVLDYAEIRPTAGSKWSWAAYLGASWTWCIGMFLPVLLIRDYGPWAWVIFAVPNVVGAAAMGWVMRTREMSHDYTIRHASACRLFSFVTIAFQLFFSVWMLPRLVGPIGYVGAAFLVQSAFTPFTRSAGLRVAGALALAFSFAVAAGLSRETGFGLPAGHRPELGDAAGLALVCLAGFIACPYLDLTFHRARQLTNNRDAKFAFGVGFGVFFASMIVLTLLYAKTLGRFGTSEGTFSNIGFWLLATHWLVQMTYTVHVHAAELQRQSESRDDAGTMRSELGLWLAIALAAGLGMTFANEHGFAFNGRSFGEAGYRVFMSFYGLLFPAYVLLAIRRLRVSVVAWLAISAVATPFYWMAFIEGRMPWAIGGVAVMLVGVLIGRRLVPSPDTPGGAEGTRVRERADG